MKAIVILLIFASLIGVLILQEMRISALEHTRLMVGEGQTLLCKQLWKKSYLCREMTGGQEKTGGKAL